MARGKPDYKNSATVYGQSITDVAELAARLSSPVRFDRRGSVIFIEDWNAMGANWSITNTGGSSYYPTNLNTYMSERAMFYTEWGVLNSYVAFQKRGPIINLGSYGVEILVSISQTQNLPIYDWITGIAYYSGSKRYQFHIKLSQGDDKLYYYCDDPTPQSWKPIKTGLGNWVLVGTPYFPQYIKVVADFQNGTYKRLLWGNQEFDLSGLLPSVAVSTSAVSWEVTLQAICRGNMNSGRLHEVIVTMDEP